MPIDASLTPRRCALLILVILGIISLIVASFLSDLRLDTRESPGDYEASWSKETAGGTDGENGRFSAEKDTGSSPGYYMQHLHWFVQVRNFISHVENVLVSINTLPTKLYCSKYFTDNAEMLRIRVYFNFNSDTDDSFSRLIIINSFIGPHPEFLSYLSTIADGYICVNIFLLHVLLIFGIACLIQLLMLAL